jgi:hypothetical protein
MAQGPYLIVSLAGNLVACGVGVGVVVNNNSNSNTTRNKATNKAHHQTMMTQWMAATGGSHNCTLLLA